MRNKAILVLGFIGAAGVTAIACSSSTTPGASDDAGGGSSSGSTSGSSSGTTTSSSSGSKSGSSSGSTSSSSGSSSGSSGGSSSGTIMDGGGDAGNWINMTGNPHGCDDHAGTPCGYAPANNGSGFTCLCYNGTFADPWGCEAAGSCVTPGPMCTGTTSNPVCDGGTTTTGDGGDGG